MQCRIKTENFIEALKLFDKCYLKPKKSTDEQFSEQGILFYVEGDKLKIYSNDTSKTAYFCFVDGVNYEVFEMLGNVIDTYYLANGHDVSQLIKALKALDDVDCIVTIPSDNGTMTIESPTFRFDLGENTSSHDPVLKTVENATRTPASGFQVTFTRKQLKELIASNESTFVTLEIPDHQQQKLGSNISTIDGIVKVIHSTSGSPEQGHQKINTLGTS